MSQIHHQTHEVTNMMSMTQKNRWMFPRNIVGHHKANAKDETQNGAQTIKKRVARLSVQALLLDMSGVPTRHVREAC
jgi:hypothetical protein